LVDSEVVDSPVRILEYRRIGGDVVNARGGRAAVIGESLAGPGATESGVEDDGVVVEVVVEVAALEIGHGLAELADIGLAGLDGRGNVVAREEPDVDVLRGPFHGVDATADAVEAGASGRCGGREESATSTVTSRL